MSVSVCLLLVQQVSIYFVTMSTWMKRGAYDHEYHHKQSKYVVKEYSRYMLHCNANPTQKTVVL